MTRQELLDALPKGFPKVEFTGLPPLKFVSSNIGQVTSIRLIGKHIGVGVQFEGVNYDHWFHDSDETDKRSRYLRDLKLVEE